MRIVVACDHAGFEVKERIRNFLSAQGFEVLDMGAYHHDPEDDYPIFIAKVAELVSQDPQNTRGIVVGGSGQGEAIVANRFPHVRAVVYLGEFGNKEKREILKLTRTHNDANILSLGARFIPIELIEDIVHEWLTTPFSEEDRHKRRIEEIEHFPK